MIQKKKKKIPLRREFSRHILSNACIVHVPVRLFSHSEDMPAGQTPHTVLVYAHGDLVDKVMPGDRVTITGIYRAQPLRPNPKFRTVQAVYKTHIDVVHYRKLDQKRLHEVGDDDT